LSKKSNIGVAEVVKAGSTPSSGTAVASAAALAQILW